MAKYKDAYAAVKEYGVVLLERSPDVLAVGVGVKSEEPIRTAKGDDFSVTAVVTRKKSLRELETERIRLFSEVVGEVADPFEPVETNVIESGGPFGLHSLRVPRIERGLHGGRRPTLDAQKYFNSLRCGIGITNPTGQYPSILSVGTLGAFLRDEEDNLYLLSNNHVIGRSDAAIAGEPVVQTGTLDLTDVEINLMPTEAELIQELKIAEFTMAVPVQRSALPNVVFNRVDAAIAEVTPDTRSLTEIDRLSYAGKILGVADPIDVDEQGIPTVPTRVYKVGRTTGFTEGEIHMLGVLDSLDYPEGRAYFMDQLLVRPTIDNGGPFSQPGDSGSIVLSDEHEVCGLLFAGSPGGTLVNPIEFVLAELSVGLGRRLRLATS